MKTIDGLNPIFLVFQLIALHRLPNQLIDGIFTFASISVGIWMLISLLIISPIFVNGSLRIFMGHIIFIIRAILPMLIIIQAYLTRSEQNQIFITLNDIDKVFEKSFAKTINYNRLRRKYFSSFFGPASALAIIRIYFIYHLMRHKDPGFRFYWFHCVQSLLVSRIRCLQTAFYANLLNDRIHWLNGELIKIDQTKRLSHEILHIKINLLRHIYTMIYDVSVLINKSFGWSLFFIALSYFADSVGNCYMYLLVIENILPKDNEVSSIVGIVSASITLIALCYSCGRCTDNAASTSELIGKIISRRTSDNELQEIMLQVCHQRVVFTAHDFFRIDMNLLVSIISATMTYIIVIIQA